MAAARNRDERNARAIMSLLDDENYPRITTTSAQSFLSCEAELHSASTHATGQKQAAIPLLHTEVGTVRDD